MKRVTVSLPYDLATALTSESQRRGPTVSERVQEALSHLDAETSRDRREVPFAGLGRSGHSHTTRDMEELLTREWDDPTGQAEAP